MRVKARGDVFASRWFSLLLMIHGRDARVIDVIRSRQR